MADGCRVLNVDCRKSLPIFNSSFSILLDVNDLSAQGGQKSVQLGVVENLAAAGGRKRRGRLFGGFGGFGALRVGRTIRALKALGGIRAFSAIRVLRGIRAFGTIRALKAIRAVKAVNGLDLAATARGLQLANRFEKLNIKVSKIISVPENAVVIPVNAVGTIYGEFRNQLSIKAEDIRIVQPPKQ